MYPIDWLVNLLEPTQWLAIWIVASLVSAIIMAIVMSNDSGEGGLGFFSGLFMPSFIGVVVAGLFHFISFLVWLWIGAPSPPA